MHIRKGIRVVGRVGALGAVLALSALPLASTAASAATLNGTATIANPTNNQPLSSGGSTTVFTVDLPAQAACSGDTASNGYHVFSYLVPITTAVTSITFVGGSPSAGFGLINGSGYYGSANTAPTTGQIISIPADFQWAYLLNLGVTASTLDSGNGEWNAGLACANSSGVVTDYWNTEVNFSASGSDSHGFIWSVGPPASTPEVPWAATFLPVGAVVLGGSLWYSRRRSRRKVLLAHQITS